MQEYVYIACDATFAIKLSSGLFPIFVTVNIVEQPVVPVTV